MEYRRSKISLMIFKWFPCHQIIKNWTINHSKTTPLDAVRQLSLIPFMCPFNCIHNITHPHPGPT